MARVYNDRVNRLRRSIASFVLLLVAVAAVLGLRAVTTRATDNTSCTLKMIQTSPATETSFFMPSLTEAVASANASANANTRFEIILNGGTECLLTDTLNIEANVTVKSSSNTTEARISRISNITIFRVGAGKSLTIENIKIDGGSNSNCLVYVGGGTFTMNGAKSTLTHCNNAETSVPKNPETGNNGPGTVYVDTYSSYLGTFYMSDGEIIENSPISGGGVYVNRGRMYMYGGKIMGNTLQSGKSGYGAGVYLESTMPLYLKGSPYIYGNTLGDAARTPQNVYYKASGTSVQGGGIHLEEDLGNTAKIGVYSQIAPSGVDESQSGSMVEITGADTKDLINTGAKFEYIIPDQEGCEVVKSTQGTEKRLLLRYGHTVTFVVDNGQGVLADYGGNFNAISATTGTMDVVHDKVMTNIPNVTGTQAGRNFEGWYEEDPNNAGKPSKIRVTGTYHVTKSVKVIAKITEGKCSEPDITSDHSIINRTDTETSTRLNIVLSGSQTSANIFLTSKAGDSDTPTDIYYTRNGIDPSGANASKLTYTADGIVVGLGATDTTIKTFAKCTGYTDSEVVTYIIHVVRVDKVEVSPEDESLTKLYKGYTANFKATVTVADGSNTGTRVTWEVDGNVSGATSITSAGVLSVAANETAPALTIRAISMEDPNQTDFIELDIGTKYVLTYDKNAPTNKTVTGTIPSVEKDAESASVTVVKNEGTTSIKCNGYTFDGWNTAKNGSGTKYNPGDTFTLKSDVTLYAQWIVNVSIDKVYVKPSDKVINQGDVLDLTVSVTGTPATGTVTWSLSGAVDIAEPTDPDYDKKTRIVPGADGKTAKLYISENEPASTNTSKIVVTATSTENTAKWGRATYTVQELTRYKVNYNGTGGIGSMASFDAAYVAGTQVEVQKCYYARVGYKFVKWNTASSGRGTDYVPGEKFTPTADTTLYAQWMKDGGTSSEEDVASEDAVSEDGTPKVKSDKQLAAECIALIEVNTDNGNVSDAYIIKGMASSIQAARAAYNALTDAQKALVGDAEYQKLVMIEAIYNRKFPVSSGNATPSNPTVIEPVVEYALPVNSYFTVGKYKYKVTLSSDTKGEVTLYRPKSANIAYVDVPNTVEFGVVTYKVTRVANYAFKGCKKLKTFTCNKTNCKAIGKQAVYGCKKLTSVTLGGGLKSVESKAFMNCTKLKNLKIGGKVTTIGTYVFYKDSSLKNTNITTNTITSIGKYSFSKIKKNAIIKMPDEYYKPYHILLKNSKIAKNTKLRTY
ncbi:MAG: leucine-rich repeat protein [Lachnospiraceae bacterium]|nr:leucine-rich repeat protein [Lachnospiraceae bacterium]